MSKLSQAELIVLVAGNLRHPTVCSRTRWHVRHVFASIAMTLTMLGLGRR